MTASTLTGRRDEIRVVGSRDPAPTNRAVGPKVPAPTLGPDQRRVLEHERGNLLVLGGPGSGKTLTLARLVVQRAADSARRAQQAWGTGSDSPGAAAQRVLVLCLNRDAVRATSTLISRYLDLAQSEGRVMPQVATFHSFALALLRQASGDEPAPRLLNATEQESRLRELLHWSVLEGRLSWPESLQGAARTRGIAVEVRRLVSRARQLGLDGRSLRRAGRRDRNETWVALGSFLDEYLDVMDHEGVRDYVELLNAATSLMTRESSRKLPRPTPFDLVVVDEFQEADPAALRLLASLARAGAQVVAFADPDQRVNDFRGAQRRNVSDFPERFAAADGSPADYLVLTTSWRVPSEILEPALRVVRPTSLAPLPAAAQRQYRSITPTTRPGEASALILPSQAAQARVIGGILLRAHVGMGGQSPLRWSQMAVIVRSPAAEAPRLLATFAEMGVPTVGARPATPLRQESAVRDLLTMVDLGVGAGVTPDAVRDLLRGIFGGIGGLELDRLLRAAIVLTPTGVPEVLQTSAVIRLLQCHSPLEELELTPRTTQALGRIRSGVLAAQSAAAAGLTVPELLWAGWDATGVGSELSRRAAGREEGHGLADRALDAVLDLFTLAAGMPAQHRGAQGARELRAQVESVGLRSSRAVPPLEIDAVQIITPHQAKGREWDLVVIAGVQEGTWRGRSRVADLLGVDELCEVDTLRNIDALGDVDDSAGAAGQDINERGLLYLATTRARSRLVITAVSDADGLTPSRLISELGLPTRHVIANEQPAIGHLAVVAELRQAAEQMLLRRARGESDALCEALGQAAIERLAVLSRQLGKGSAADPTSWWWARTPSHGRAQAPSQGDAVSMSPSGMAAILNCPLRWYLERRVGLAGPVAATAGVGLLVHKLAQLVASGELPPRQDAMLAAALKWWPEVQFSAQYQRRSEWDRLGAMLAAFCRWHLAGGRAPLVAELGFSVELRTSSGPIVLRGSIDRIDRDPDGNLYIVDFKTSRSAMGAAEAGRHPQLAAYQVAVELGALGQVAGAQAVVAAAELVYLSDTFASGMPKVRHQPSLQSGGAWAWELIESAAMLARGDSFPARPGPGCRTCPFRTSCPGLGASQVAMPEEVL